MTDLERFERGLEVRIERHVAGVVRPFDAAAIARQASAASARPRPHASWEGRWPRSRLLVLAAVLAAALGGAALVGAPRLAPDPAPRVAPGRFEPTGTLREALDTAQGVALTDGRALVVGLGGGIPQVAVWDRATGAFEAFDAIGRGRPSTFRLLALPRGGALLALRAVEGPPDPWLLTWDAMAPRFVRVPLPGDLPDWDPLTVMDDGRVLGVTCPPGCSAQHAVAWDPATGAFEGLESWEGRAVAAAAPSLGGGDRIVTLDGEPADTLSVWAWRTPDQAGRSQGDAASRRRWVGDSRSMTQPVTRVDAVPLALGRVALLPHGADGPLDGVLVWSPYGDEELTWVEQDAPVQAVAPIAPDRMLLFITAPDGTSSAVVWDAETGSTTSGPALPAGTYVDAAVPLPDGRTLVIAPSPEEDLTRTLVYEP